MESTITKWVPPEEPYFKVNFHSAWDPNRSRGGIGIIVRDKDGKVVTAAAQRLDIAQEACMVQAMAAIKAMEVAQWTGCKKIILEGEALAIMKKLQNDVEAFSALEPLIIEGRMLRDASEECKITQIRREGNGAAHLLSEHGLLLDEDIYWVEDYPEFMTAK